MRSSSPLVLPIALLLLLAVLHLRGQIQGGAFEVPDQNERAKAIGSVVSLPPQEKAAYQPDVEFFETIRAPKRMDWLGSHPEPGQTFDQFRSSRPRKPDRVRKVIYIQPIGEFDKERAPDMAKLHSFASAFFTGTEVKVAPPMDPAELNLRGRDRGTDPRHRQILSTDVLGALKTRLPKDAFCVLAVTMTDLYPDPQWNFVFGQASLRDRVGVFSFARYHPDFHGSPIAEDKKEEATHLVLERSGKVLVHEVGHMFGIKHCVHFECIMNGSNHLAETDSRPARLCPVCLRKLQWGLGFDSVDRYEALGKWYGENGFEAEKEWMTKRRVLLLQAGEGQ